MVVKVVRRQVFEGEHVIIILALEFRHPARELLLLFVSFLLLIKCSPLPVYNRHPPLTAAQRKQLASRSKARRSACSSVVLGPLGKAGVTASPVPCCRLWEQILTRH